MSKTISVLEKEMNMWRSKYEKCNKALIDTAEEVRRLVCAVCGDVIMMSSTSQRLHYERQAHVFRTKNEKLEKLCRALQQERNQLQDQVRKVSAMYIHLCM